MCSLWLEHFYELQLTSLGLLMCLQRCPHRKLEFYNLRGFSIDCELRIFVFKWKKLWFFFF